MEEFVSGYCRVLDGARTVLVDLDDRCADCAYPDCAYAGECPVAREIAERLKVSYYIK